MNNFKVKKWEDGLSFVKNCEEVAFYNKFIDKICYKCGWYLSIDENEFIINRVKKYKESKDEE